MKQYNIFGNIDIITDYGEIIFNFKNYIMKRIYHPYNLWEDYKHGFYDNCSGEKKKEYEELVIKMFSSEKLTRENMYRVINEWKYSCEHNLSNESMNKIAYIGQAACCIYAGIPNTITMSTWSKVSEEKRIIANEIAEEVLNKWINNNKNLQLCLNLD